MISISYMETGGGIAGCQRLKLVPAVGESKLIVRHEREWTLGKLRARSKQHGAIREPATTCVVAGKLNPHSVRFNVMDLSKKKLLVFGRLCRV